MLFVGVGIVAYLVRVILHAISCKAKKGIACNKVSEVYKYLWAHLITMAVSVFAFMEANLFHFGVVKERFGNLIRKILDNAQDIGPLANILAILLLFIISYILTLLVCNVVYALKSKKTLIISPPISQH